MSVREPAVRSLPARGGARTVRLAPPVERTGAGARRLGWVGLSGIFLAAGLILVSAAHTPALLPESIRPAPAALSGVLGGVGLDLHVLGAMGVLVLMFAAYALVVSPRVEIAPRLAVGAIVLLVLLVLLAPPLFSTDVFSYQAYARMGAHYGIDPYTNGPHAIAFDGIFPYVGAKWSYIPSAYGPVFTVASYALGGLSVAGSVLAYKLVAAAACLGLVALVWRSARRRGIDPVRAGLIVGLNPLLVVYGVGGGHNDLLMLLALGGGIYALLCGRARTGGALGALAVGVKLTAGLVLPFALVAGRLAPGAEPDEARSARRRLATGLLAGLAVVVALGVALFGSGSLHLLATVTQSQSEGDWKSIPGAIADRLHLPLLAHVTSGLLVLGFLLVLGRLLLAVRRGRMDWIDGAGWATLALLIASSSLLPWYVGWLLPLAALARDARLRTTATVMTGLVLGVQLLGFVPHGTPLF